MAATKQFSAAGDFDLRSVHDGFTGRFAIQISAISGQTVTPQISADDGVNWVTRAVTPADNSADVITMTTTGLWVMDALTCWGRLHITGAGSCTITVRPAVG